MSLIIEPYYRKTKNGALVDVEEKPKAPYNNLFGPEDWRKTVWGSGILKEINCVLLSSLNTQDIYAEDEQIQQLKKELKIAKKNISQITGHLAINQESFQFRLDNAFEAIRIAEKQINGGIYIG